jgi:hypothetical protein
VEEVLDFVDVFWVGWELSFAGDFAGFVLLSFLTCSQVGVLDSSHEILVLTCHMYKFGSLLSNTTCCRTTYFCCGH